ncbi:hypothetical protein ACFM35_01725 [Microbacterium sp. P01]|uniref:hypothetical protein n=1 Tax=Microbacterium sp. P01 TaxID=3366261 RepID=UPI00366F7CEF
MACIVLIGIEECLKVSGTPAFIGCRVTRCRLFVSLVGISKNLDGAVMPCRFITSADASSWLAAITLVRFSVP